MGIAPVARTGVSDGDHVAAFPIQLHEAAGWGRPAVWSSMAYYLSRRHEVIAVDCDTGKTRWRQPLGAQPGLTAGTAVVVERAVVVAGDYDLFGFDAVTGAVRWRFIPAAGYGPGPYLGAAAEGMVFAGSASGHAFALEVETGQPRWTSRTLGQNVTIFAPTFSDGLVAAAYTDFTTPRRGGLVVLDARTGAVRWRQPLSGPSPDRPTSAAGGPVFAGDLVVAASSDGMLHAFDRESGRSMWTVPPVAINWSVSDVTAPSAGFEDFRALAYLPSTLLATSLAGVLVAVNATTHAERWRYSSPEDGSIAFGIAFDGQTAYVPYASGRLVAIDVVTGRERWRAGGATLRFDFPPAMTGDRLYLTSEDGLYVLPTHH